MEIQEDMGNAYAESNALVGSWDGTVQNGLLDDLSIYS